MKYEGKQESASAQVTVGYGASGSASYSKSKMKADMATVNQQAGVFAGDEGYEVDIANHTDLTGGLVTSSQKAESEGKNRFSTGTLSSKEIASHAEHKGSAIGLNGSATIGGGWKGNEQDGVGLAVGLGADKDSQRSQTVSGINTANLTIRDEKGQQEKTGKTATEIKAEVKTEMTTDTAAAHSGKLESRFDKNQLQKELDYQVKATSEFQSITKPAIDEVMASHATSKRKEADDLEKQGKYQQAEQMRAEAKDWETGGKYRQAVDSITNAVGLALGGKPTEGVIAGAASPYINEQIKKATEHHPELNIPAHMIWGAIEAELQGGKATSGAVAAGVGEAGAHYLTQALYGTDNPETLTEAQKKTIADLSKVAGGVAAGLSSAASSGNSLTMASSVSDGIGIAESAVENNSLLVDRFRENKKADAERWKENVRKTLGEGTPSQVINGVINLIEETSDGALFVLDGAFDAFSVITTCALGDSYCSQAKQDLAGKGEAISSSVNTLMSGEYWESVKDKAQKAYQGDQKALEDFSGMVAGLILPTKAVPNKSKLADFSYKVPDEINSGKQLPVVGKTDGYENQTANLKVSTGAESAFQYQKLKLDLKVEQSANEVISSLKATGELPKNYITKEEAQSKFNWKPGKALKEGQIGGDIFSNKDGLLPQSKDRVWREADIGINNQISRNKQSGTRLLYSNDGLLFITTDHYQTFKEIGTWK